MSQASPNNADPLPTVDEEFDALIRRVSIWQPPGDMPDGSVLLLESTVVEADTIKVKELAAITVELPDPDSGAPERNGCRSIAQGVEYASCGQWIYMPPRPINPASSPADMDAPSSGTD